jgi:methylmalonyl-CoA/ethylmalonyl-CoA epimerase
MGSGPDLDGALAGAGAVFDHVAHAVPSIRDVLPLYVDLLGGEIEGGGFNPWGGHLAVQLIYPGGSRLELLEPTRPDSQSCSGFLARNRRGGLHHLTFKVADIRAALDSLGAAGFEPFGLMLDDPGWREAYLHPRQTSGVLVQIAQSSGGIPPPFKQPIDAVLDEAEAMRKAAEEGGAA